MKQLRQWRLRHGYVTFDNPILHAQFSPRPMKSHEATGVAFGKESEDNLDFLNRAKDRRPIFNEGTGIKFPETGPCHVASADDGSPGFAGSITRNSTSFKHAV